MIRFAETDDLPDIRSLWETCFPDESGFNEYYFKNIFKLDNTLVLKNTDGLEAMLQMLPYFMAVGEKVQKITYIYGACTSPEHRKKGCMAKLLERSFELDKEYGHTASVLIPQHEWLFGFYKKFGYEPFFKVSKETVFSKETEYELPTKLQVKATHELQKLYEKLVSPCHILRSPAEWRKQIALFEALGKGVYGWLENGKLSGYVFCYGDSVQEAFGMTEKRYQGLLRELKTDRLECVSYGVKDFLGSIKWYKTEKSVSGYMNLMFN